MVRPRIGISERRRLRLAHRHRLVPAEKTDDAVAVADSLVAVHSTDPVTVYLSMAARMPHPALEPLATALYDEHTLIRHHAMRRTLWVMTPQVAELAQAACTRGLVAPEWKRIVKLVQDSGIAADGEAWLRAAKRDTHAALVRLGAAPARRIGQEVPELTKPLHMAVGKSYAASPAAHTRVLLLLGFDGVLVRGRPVGSWINSQYTWTPIESVLPGGFADLDEAAARAGLVERYLRAFGPATTADIRWWLGATATAVRAALAAVQAVEVDLDADGVGWVLPDDTGTSDPAERWVALLPGLDSTTMGWKERNWYLGALGPDVFDSNGNGGPTIWVDGEIVGSWVQRKDGAIATVVRAPLSRGRLNEIERAAEDVRELLGETRYSVRFPAPIQPELFAR